MALKIKNISRYLGDDQWEWDAFLDANQSGELDDIKYVEYVLHPTFDNPIREIDDRKSKFMLSTSGWGTFKLKAFAYKKDGTKVKLEHELELDYPVVVPFSIIAKTFIINNNSKEEEATQKRSFVLMNCSEKIPPIPFKKLEIFFEKSARVEIHLWDDGNGYGNFPINSIGKDGKVLLKDLILTSIFDDFKSVVRIGFLSYQGDVELKGIVSEK